MRTFIFSIVLLASFSASAQSKNYDKDVASIDAIVTALYEVITGPAEQPRDWDRFRNLFKPESRMIPTNKNAQGEYIMSVLTPEDYVQRFTARKVGFFEVELHHTVEEYGTIAHVFSTYETKEVKDGPVTNRGINSIQLFKDKNRYYVINIFWCAESAGFPLPAKYLN